MIAHKPKPRPYTQLHDEVERTLALIPDFKGDLYIMMAVCVKESMGVPWFCRCDSLFNRNFREVREAFGIRTANDFLREITVRGGLNAGKIPKFKFEEGWYDWNLQDQNVRNMPLLEVITMSCSYGLAQKPAIDLHDGLPMSERRLMLRQLLRDPMFQLMQLASDLNEVGAFTGQETASKVAIWKSRQDSRTPKEYGAQIMDLANDFRQKWESPI
jgi:hypothetical protein